MEFCRKCGARLVTDVENQIFRCSKCGFSMPISGVQVSKRVRKKPSQLVVIEDKDKVQVYPIARVECSKCGFNKAEWWTVQTRASDEGSTQFYRCLNCGYTWRLYT